MGKMKNMVALLLLIAIAMPVRAADVVPASESQINLTFAPIVRKAAPAVVNIATRTKVQRRQRDPFFNDPFFRRFFEGFPGAPRAQPRAQQSAGSGAIIRDDGLVVTNHHVIENADEIKVVLSDRREFTATLLMSDERSDLALLTIDGGGDRFPVIELGDSDGIEVGDLVLAIGNPFGIGQTVTSGIISATARTAPSLESDVSFIQTDAAINPGNSGGALVTLDGRLVGVNTAIFTRGGGSIGIGFAIPANLVRARINQLEAEGGMVVRPWLGASLQPVDSGLARSLGLDRPRGVMVNQIYPEAAAGRAGIEVGDVILTIDGVVVSDVAGLNFRLNLKPMGARVAMKLWRGGREIDASVILERPIRVPAPDVTQLEVSHPLAGLRLANMSPSFNAEIGVDPFARGIIVLDILRRSSAHRMGFQVGDVIAGIDGDTSITIGDMNVRLTEASPPWRMTIRRGRQRFQFDLEP